MQGVLLHIAIEAYFAATSGRQSPWSPHSLCLLYGREWPFVPSLHLLPPVGLGLHRQPSLCARAAKMTAKKRGVSAAWRAIGVPLSCLKWMSVAVGWMFSKILLLCFYISGWQLGKIQLFGLYMGIITIAALVHVQHRACFLDHPQGLSLQDAVTSSASWKYTSGDPMPFVLGKSKFLVTTRS